MKLSSIRVLLASALVVMISLTACSAEKTSGGQGDGGAKPAAGAADPGKAAAAAATAVGEVVVASPTKHHAKCGCSIDGIGHCGNYIQIGEEYVELVWPELGRMEYCKEKAAGADIEVTGKVTDGKFVAQTYKRLD